MKTKVEKHREAGTLDQLRARQAASRAGTARYQARLVAERASCPSDTELLDWLEMHDDRFYHLDRISAVVGQGFNGHTSLRDAIRAEMEANS